MPPKWAYDGSRSTEREVAEFLAGLVRVAKPAVVVETGTFKGTTAVRLSDALKANEYGHLWTLENEPELASRYAEMELERTTFVDADSLTWEPPAPIDLAFIDCGEPEHRAAVVERFRQGIAAGGFLALHDHVFYPELEAMAGDVLGPAALRLPAVNGLLIWQIGRK
jgi:predicted O-methyltransferase YrrM